MTKLRPDIQAAAAFLEALCNEPDPSVCFQIFSDDKDDPARPSAEFFHARLSDASEYLANVNSLGAGIFVTVNETDGNGRKKENIAALRALFVDKDKGERLPVEVPLLNIRTSSRNGDHGYWLLTPNEQLDRFVTAQKQLIGHFGSDPKVHDLGRVMRLPGFLHMKTAPFLVASSVLSVERHSIDEILSRFPAAREPKRPSRQRPVQIPLSRTKAQIEIAKRVCQDALTQLGPSIESDGGDDNAYVAACICIADHKLSPDDALELLNEWNRTCDPPWSPRELAQKIKNAQAYAQQLTTSDARQTVFLSADLHTTTQRLLRGLAASSDAFGPVTHGRTPARIVDHDDAAIVERLDQDKLIFEIGRRIRLVRQTKDGIQKANLTPNVARNVLASSTFPFPRVDTVISSPVFAPSGALVSEPGINEEARVFYRPAAGFVLPPIPESPSSAEIAAALRKLREPFAEFPFVSGSDWAHLLASMLTLVLRPVIDGPTPAFFLSAPSSRTGKSLLMECIGMLTLGRIAACIGLPTGDSDDTVEKLLLSKLLEAPSVLVFDNVRGFIKSAPLERAITARAFESRVLGVSQMKAPAVRCVFFINGNQARLSTDLAKRTIPIRLDAKSQNPEGREFKIKDVLGFIRENRSGLIAALLTIARAGLKRKPQRHYRLGGFERWLEVIGGVMEACGVSDFLASLPEFVNNADSDNEPHIEFVSRWHAVFSTNITTTRALFEKVYPQISELLFIPRAAQQNEVAAFGSYLSNTLRDRTFFGLQISREKALHGSNQWRLKIVDPAAYAEFIGRCTTTDGGGGGPLATNKREVGKSANSVTSPTSLQRKPIAIRARQLGGRHD